MSYNFYKDIILISQEGNGNLADFGIAKILIYQGDMGATIAYSKDYSAQSSSMGNMTRSTTYLAPEYWNIKSLLDICLLITPNRVNRQLKPFPNTLDSFLKESITRMLNLNPGKRPIAEKVFSVMGKEFEEIKKGRN